MGINTKGKINSSCGVKDIQRALKSKFSVDSEIIDTTFGGYYILSFNYNGESREISIFESYVDDVSGELETRISCGMWGSSVEIIRGIVESFGGYVEENDCENDWQYVSPISKISLTDEEILEDNLYVKLNDTDMNFVEKQNIVKYVKDNLEWIKTL